MTGAARFPRPFVEAALVFLEQCAEIRSTMSAAAAQDIPSRPVLEGMGERVEADRAEFYSAAKDLRDIERAIAKALRTK